MKGIVFNVLEQFVEENIDSVTWDETLNELELSNYVFVSTKNYEDQKLLSIFNRLVLKKNLVATCALEKFGQFLFFKLIEKNRALVSQFPDARSFLLGLDSIIHVEVKKMMSGAQPPSFLTILNDDNVLILEYRSQRQLCHLAYGLLLGLSQYFQESFKFSQIKCVHEGESTCLFEFTFEGAPC